MTFIKHRQCYNRVSGMTFIKHRQCYNRVSGMTFMKHRQCYNRVNEYMYAEEFEDTKEVIRIRKSKKNRQYNGQKKTHNRTNNDLQNIHIKLKIK